MAILEILRTNYVTGGSAVCNCRALTRKRQQQPPPHHRCRRGRRGRGQAAGAGAGASLIRLCWLRPTNRRTNDLYRDVTIPRSNAPCVTGVAPRRADAVGTCRKKRTRTEPNRIKPDQKDRAEEHPPLYFIPSPTPSPISHYMSYHTSSHHFSLRKLKH